RLTFLSVKHKGCVIVFTLERLSGLLTVDGSKLLLVCSGQDLFVQSLSVFELPLLQVIFGLGHVGVIGSQFGLVDLEGPSVVVLHLVVLPLVLTQQRQVVQLLGYIWVLKKYSDIAFVSMYRLFKWWTLYRKHTLFTLRVGAVGLYLLSDLQRSLAQRFGLLVFPSLSVQDGQVVEGGGHSGVILPQRLLSDGQRVVQQILQSLFAERHGHLVAALRGVLDHQVVQRPEAGRDLVAPLLSRHLSAAGLALVLLLRRRHVIVKLLDLVHEHQVLLLLLQLRHALLAALQFVLRPGQLVPQPLVLLAEPAHLSPQLLLLRLHGAQVARQGDDHL
ncbi:hypothetical protein F7725_004681, partial [Dissostichus mawsoni]